MIFPLRDSAIRLRFPWVTLGLIGLNVILFGYGRLLPPESYRDWLIANSLIPAQLFRSGLVHPFRMLLSSMFMHANLMHLTGNMLYLWIFGDNIENELGAFNFVVFYLLAGLGAALLQVLIDSTSPIPVLGASGAVSGILGAYLLRYPRARIQVLLFFFIYIRRVWIPAVYLLGFWFLIQLSNAMNSLNMAQSGGVAWFAHIGGFLVGIILLLAMRPYERKRLWKVLNRES